MITPTGVTEEAGHPPPPAYSPAPRVPNGHLFLAGTRPMLLSVSRGEIYELDELLAHSIDRAMEFGDTERVSQFLAAAGILDLPVPEQAPRSVPVRALSLAVAQKCNLGCTYCYAQQGNFGGQDSSMSADVARAAVDRLLDGTKPGEAVTLAFLGGEPLVARAVLQETTEYAAEKAVAAGVRVGFALTTNATLLTEGDAEFFDRYAFAITVSVDGVREKHDLLRPFKSGQGSYERVVERSGLLLARTPRRMQVTARVTVTPRNLQLPETLDELVQLGFDGVLFSPVLSSPTGLDQMRAGDFDELLSQFTACGRAFEQRLRMDQVYPFLNVINTLRRIHGHRRDAYPCGAGGGYLGVSANGGLYACHRFVDDEAGAMGSVAEGVDRRKQQLWLVDRNVHTQEPCRSCWARYLCGGGCHYEAIRRGRPACDYIRGWLHYCLGLYVALVRDNPPLLGQILNSQQSQ
jgi:uncharacterized protein